MRSAVVTSVLHDVVLTVMAGGEGEGGLVSGWPAGAGGGGGGGAGWVAGWSWWGRQLGAGEQAEHAGPLSTAVSTDQSARAIYTSTM